MPRNRSDARLAVLGPPFLAPGPQGCPPAVAPPSGGGSSAGLLVFLSIVLITVYFREPSNGGLHGVQSAGATVLRPFEVGAERIAQPFRDAYGWFAGLVHAKSENSRLRAEVDKYRQLAIQNEGAAQVNSDLKQRWATSVAPRFPGDYNDVNDRRSLRRSPSEFDQQLTVAAGTSSGIRVADPVVTADGLVGHVTKVAHDTAQVTLLTDPERRSPRSTSPRQASGMVAAGQARAHADPRPRLQGAEDPSRAT